MSKDLTITDSANVFQATQISTLNNIPTNASVKIVGDPSGFELYKETTLENAILYSQLETSGYTQINPSTESTNVVIQFANTNWVDTRDMYIMAQVTLSVQTPNYETTGTPPVQNPIDPILINNPAQSVGFGMENSLNLLTNKFVPSYQPFSEGVYKCGGLLNCFKKIECIGGTNNQQLGRATMYPQPYLSILSTDVKVDEEEALIRGRIGMPFSHDGYESSPTSKTYGLTGDLITNANLRTIDSYFKGFEALIRQASVNYGATATIGASSSTFTNTFYVAIPLRMLGEFYQINKTLPPEFKHRLTFQVKNTPTFLYAENPTSYDDGLNIWTALIHPESLQLHYMSKTLTPTLQEQLNIKWTSNPFVFDIMTNDPYSYQGYPYQQTIVTSYTRPNTLVIFVTANKDKTWVKGDETVAVGIANTVNSWLTAAGEPVRILRIRISLSGRTPIDIDMTLNNSGQVNMPTGHETIINSYQNKTLKSLTGPLAHMDTNAGTMNSGAVGKIIYVPFTPSMYWDMQKYPVDMGSVQLRLEVITSAPLDPDLTLNVNKTVIDQYALDTNNKISVVTWPKRIIQTGNSTELLSKTVVPAS
jgi:hypothetical protein